MKVLNRYEQDGLSVTEYTNDGVNVSHVVKTILITEPIEINPLPTLEEIQEQTLLETQYQTLLIEMLAGF